MADSLSTARFIFPDYCKHPQPEYQKGADMTLLGSTPLLLVLVAITTIAVLYYSAVGHGGGSGYIAIMALCSLPMSVVKPTALLLNILVALIAVYAYTRAGHFRWEVFWPFSITSIPFSFIGGAMTLPAHYLKPVVQSSSVLPGDLLAQRHRRGERYNLLS